MVDHLNEVANSNCFEEIVNLNLFQKLLWRVKPSGELCAYCNKLVKLLD